MDKRASEVQQTFETGLTRIRQLSAGNIFLHLWCAVVLIWAASQQHSAKSHEEIIGVHNTTEASEFDTKMSGSSVFMSLLGVASLIPTVYNALWSWKGTTAKEKPDYKWMTKGFMISVANYLSVIIPIFPGWVLYMFHSQGLNLFTGMEIWKTKDGFQDLYKALVLHIFCSLMSCLVGVANVVHLSVTLLKIQDDEGDDDEDDDADEVGQRTTLHVVLAGLAFIGNVLIFIDYVNIAVAAGIPNSGLTINTMLMFAALCARFYLLKTGYQKLAIMEKDWLINYRIYCLFELTLVWVFAWIDTALVVLLMQWKKDFFVSVFGLKSESRARVLMLIICFIFLTLMYAVKLYSYQKCMWLVDEIQSQMLSDAMVMEDDGEGMDMEDDGRQGSSTEMANLAQTVPAHEVGPAT